MRFRSDSILCFLIFEMEVVGATAAVAHVIEISVRVIGLCQGYYTRVKDARKSIRQLGDQLTGLSDVLMDIYELAHTTNTVRLKNLEVLSRTNGPTQQCEKDLLALREKLEAGKGGETMKQFGLTALKWPFHRKEVEELTRAIKQHIATFTLALTTDHV